MTAFEILLNEFYNTILKNKPEQKNQSSPNYSIELKKVIKDYVNMSFTNGHNLSYKQMISELMERGADLLKNSNYEDWAEVKYVFQQNELHYIKRGRNLEEVEKLKFRLEQML